MDSAGAEEGPQMARSVVCREYAAQEATSVMEKAGPAEKIDQASVMLRPRLYLMLLHHGNEAPETFLYQPGVGTGGEDLQEHDPVGSHSRRQHLLENLQGFSAEAVQGAGGDDRRPGDQIGDGYQRKGQKGVVDAAALGVGSGEGVAGGGENF